jgi:hypothetical protein
MTVISPNNAMLQLTRNSKIINTFNFPNNDFEADFDRLKAVLDMVEEVED